MTRCYSVPVWVFINADSADEALEVAREELHHMCKGDHPIVAYDVPVDGTNLTHDGEEE